MRFEEVKQLANTEKLKFVQLSLPPGTMEANVNIDHEN